ncbi:hypothetical protein PCASD_14827 [Puccinia coronata f. sp. avenae]|uniref:Tet-like 2OG-Fe(II) oxygenase domain-containing protein n=1 Tax=Puccinia coronata f. sp. avenae TaxID=200324 RepID=A0A2N5TCQ6_9BASI|nr:hypothetical protein PCASD_14827 [Puccinia coronata f. sp. avenae]
MVHDPKVFKLFTHGKIVVLDHHHRDQILAVIKFTPIKDLLPKDKKDLQFLSHFLHESKEFVNPVKSTGQSWGGHMWALGWRKAMAAAELIGRYIKQLAVRKNPQKYDKLMSTSERASNILDTMFKSMASIPFRKNQALMKENQIPSFSSLKFHSPIHRGLIAARPLGVRTPIRTPRKNGVQPLHAALERRAGAARLSPHAARHVHAYNRCAYGVQACRACTPV